MRGCYRVADAHYKVPTARLLVQACRRAVRIYLHQPAANLLRCCVYWAACRLEMSAGTRSRLAAAAECPARNQERTLRWSTPTTGQRESRLQRTRQVTLLSLLRTWKRLSLRRRNPWQLSSWSQLLAASSILSARLTRHWYASICSGTRAKHGLPVVRLTPTCCQGNLLLVLDAPEFQWKFQCPSDQHLLRIPAIFISSHQSSRGTRNPAS